ncbi:hypothetical protein ACGFR8_26030 [Streptomyces brevispora]|uniref:hypothetical protein n=1 Tax=Streptomyces brevispora TaxID=887462 RepID=UPI003716FFD3
MADHGQDTATERHRGTAAAGAEVIGEGRDLAGVAVVAEDLGTPRGTAEDVGDLGEGGVAVGGLAGRAADDEVGRLPLYSPTEANDQAKKLSRT